MLNELSPHFIYTRFSASHMDNKSPETSNNVAAATDFAGCHVAD